MSTPFKHNLTSDNLAGLYGYGDCLKGLLQYIHETTGFNPEKRYIDSVDLLDKIAASSADVSRLLKEAEVKIKNNQP